MYYNAPTTNLPVDALSNEKIASLGQGRLGPAPEFLLNLANNSTPVVPSSGIQWDEQDGETDSGNYPIGQSTLVSYYVFGLLPTVAAAPAGGYGQDDHIIVLNQQTCELYETFAMQSNAPPYHEASGSIINIGDYNLRTAYRDTPVLVDSYGLDNGTASGQPIWPFVLTHAEAYSGQPILHSFRFALPQSLGSAGFQWPGTHAAGGTGSNGIYMASQFRLKASFNINTCLNGNVGEAFTPQFQQVLIAMQTYGLFFTDYGYPGLVSTDADQAWGDPGSSTSDNWVFAGMMHCVQFSDLEVVDNTPRVISATSGQVNLSFIPR
jgi:hypothetical protein